MKQYVKRSFFFTLVLLVAAVLALLVFTGLAEEYNPTLYNDLPDYLHKFKDTVERQALKYPGSFYLSLYSGDKVVYLTFDDGPDAVYTPRILQILKEKGIKASFFLIGENVERYPEVAVSIKEGGHFLGNHSWSHPDFRKLAEEKILLEELNPTAEIIEKITGISSRVLRPPYGAINDSTIERLRESDWKIVNWSIDSFDWDRSRNGPEEIKTTIISYIHPGAVVLMHSGGSDRSTTVQILADLIEELRERGYQFRTLADLYNSEA